jgi:hypothetical protein
MAKRFKTKATFTCKENYNIRLFLFYTIIIGISNRFLFI